MTCRGRAPKNDQADWSRTSEFISSICCCGSSVPSGARKYICANRDESDVRVPNLVAGAVSMSSEISLHAAESDEQGSRQPVPGARQGPAVAGRCDRHPPFRLLECLLSDGTAVRRHRREKTAEGVLH